MNKLHKYEIGGFLGLLVLFIIFQLNNMNFFNINNLRLFINSLGFYAPIFFILVAILLLLLTFPMSIMVVFSGMIFGMVRGYFYSFLILTIASFIAFNLSRSFSKKFKKEAKEKKSTYISRLVEKIEKNVLKYPFLSVFLPIIFFFPYIEICYASGLVKSLKGIQFIIAIFFANLFQVFVLIFLGDSLTKNLNLFLIAIGLFLLFLLIPRIFKLVHPKFHQIFHL